MSESIAKRNAGWRAEAQAIVDSKPLHVSSGVTISTTTVRERTLAEAVLALLDERDALCKAVRKGIKRARSLREDG